MIDHISFLALQDLPKTNGKTCKKYWSLATRFRSAGVSINNDELRDSLSVTASEVRISFIFAHSRDGKREREKKSTRFF
jgi:hypothetical protein